MNNEYKWLAIPFYVTVFLLTVIVPAVVSGLFKAISALLLFGLQTAKWLEEETDRQISEFGTIAVFVFAFVIYQYLNWPSMQPKPCSSCGQGLKTRQARQCLHFGADWH